MNSRLKRIQDWGSLARQAKWSVANLAQLCGVSTRTLERHFQETRQQTPEAWLAEQRWRLALELLEEGFPVKAIACELGYQHPGTLSREFKKRFLQSPSDFVKTPLREGEMSRKAI